MNLTSTFSEHKALMDMEPKPGIFGRAIQFSYAIGLPPMRILKGLVFFLIAGLILGALFVFDIPNPFKSSNKADPEDDKLIEYVAQPELAQKALTLDEQINEIYYFKQDENLNYVVAIGEIEAQRAKIRELLDREDISAKQKNQLQFTLLRHGQSVLQMNFLARVLEPAEVDQFNTFARSFIGGADANLEDFAKFTISDAETLLLRRIPREEIAERLSEAFAETKSSFLNNETRAQQLYEKLMQARRIHPGKPHIEKAIRDFGKLLATSKDESVVKLSTTIGEFSRFAPFEIGTLETRIRLKVKGSLQDLDDAFRALGDAPETDIETWKTLIRSYESSISNGQSGVLQTGWRIASDLVRKLPESDAKKATLEAHLEKQLERSKKLGSTINLQSYDTVQGNPLPKPESLQLLVFADRNSKSADMFTSLNRRQQEGAQLKQPLLAFKDDYTQEDHDRLNSVKNFQMMSFESAQELMETLSIDTFPYLVAIDPQGNVVAINLSVEQAVQQIMERN